MSRVLLFLGVSISLLFPGYTQDIPVGTWRNHFSFESTQLVAGDGDRIFAASQFALFLFENEEVTRLSKIDGLNGGAITGLNYQAEGDVLLIGYEDGGVDLIKEGILKNLTDLTDGSFGLDRSVNGFIINNDQAFAPTGFGIATINLNTQEITEVFREIGPNGTIVEIHEILLGNDQLYAVTESGILSGNINSNLLDFNNWTLDTETAGFENLTLHQGQIYASEGNIIFLLDPVSGVWNSFFNTSFDILGMDVFEGRIYLMGSTQLTFLENGEQTAVPTTNLAMGVDLDIDQGIVYIADEQNGLIEVTNLSERVIIPNGPGSDQITRIKYADSLFAFYATPPGTQQLDSMGYAVFDNGRWNNHVIEGFYNISDVATYDGAIYLSSNTQGIYNLSANDFVTDAFNEVEATIPALSGSSDGLYAIRNGHSNALYRLNEGTWDSWPANTVGSSDLIDMTLSQGNVLWLTNGTNRGMIAYDPINDQSRVINQSDGLASANIRSTIIDLDDQAWIGTQSGISFFVDATFVFDNFNAFTPFFENRELFDEEAVTAMAVDGGNRKWMATRDGVWVFDSNVITLETRFTSENSPLPSNTVLDFAYDPVSGEMFILTDRGLVSYRTGSSSGRATHSDVQIFPNPIRPQTPGPITLRGLAQDANIKITDVRGNLIREVTALGGTATWDLRDTSGNQAVSGIYLFFSSTGNRQETLIGKIAVIR